MKKADFIKSMIARIDGEDYGAYQSLKGEYDFGDFRLRIERIPKDPYAPSFSGLYRAFIDRSYTYIPSGLDGDALKSTAYADYMVRRFFRESDILSSHRGTGNSGLITVDEPGQAILLRNSLIIGSDGLELRFFIGLPANGRTIEGALAEKMILEELPRIINAAFARGNIDPLDCQLHVKTAEDAHCLRSQLQENNLVAFVADGSVLPRKGGDSDKPMDRDKATLIISPETLAVDMRLSDGSAVRGMGIPGGITLIVGGGYHGKSTLLNALAAGVYNHIPGDGRERAVSLDSVLKMRACSGRFVEKVNISSFIDNLPGNTDTAAFSTDNASGSTSQAAALIEGLEAGAEVLLMDEDTSATNFMIRDRKMQALVAKEDEPIWPFIDRVEQLYGDEHVSTILVLGGSGDYFSVSRTVIQMKEYLPFDVSAKARDIALHSAEQRLSESGSCSFERAPRIPLAGSVDPLNQYGKKSVFVREKHRINMGRYTIELNDLEQILEISQTKAITEAILSIAGKIDGHKNLCELLAETEERIGREGLDCLSEILSGNLAEFRIIELAGALNRLRSLRIK